MTPARHALLATALLLLPAAAQARPSSVDLCFDLEVSYDDASTGDYWTANAAQPASYVHAVVKSSKGTAFDGYLDANGCTGTLSLESRLAYSVVLYSEALVTGDNEVKVYDDSTSPAVYSWTAASAFKPSHKMKTRSWTWPLVPSSGKSYVSNVLAATTYAIDTHSGGVTNDLFVVFHDPCPSGTGSCLRSTTLSSSYTSWPTTYISDTDAFGDRYKYVIAHELGHLVGAMVDEHRRVGGQNATANQANDSALSSCADGSGHHQDSEEWQNTAVNEGFAHFYAAVVWNSGAELDCAFWEWKPDDEEISCEYGGRFMEDTCYGGATPPYHTANPGDWMRFWWDLYSDEAMSFEDVAAIWDAAEPGSWTSASSGFDVYSELRTGAISEGVSSTVWDDWAAFNGVDW